VIETTEMLAGFVVTVAASGESGVRRIEIAQVIVV
jgi:hypothetical protein